MDSSYFMFRVKIENINQNNHSFIRSETLSISAICDNQISPPISKDKYTSLETFDLFNDCLYVDNLLAGVNEESQDLHYITKFGAF